MEIVFIIVKTYPLLWKFPLYMIKYEMQLWLSSNHHDLVKTPSMGGGCKDEKYWNMLNIFSLKSNQNQLVHYMLLQWL